MNKDTVIKVITIDENTRAVRRLNNLQWIAEGKRVAGDDAKIPGEITWITLGYFSKLSYLGKFLLERCDDKVSGDIHDLINSFNLCADKIVVACDKIDGDIV
jgi:hypothetical protein